MLATGTFSVSGHFGLVGHELSEALGLLHAECSCIHSEMSHPCGEIRDDTPGVLYVLQLNQQELAIQIVWQGPWFSPSRG